MFPDDATIFAPATGFGRSAIAVIRVSGAAAGPVLDALSPGAARPEPRRAVVRRLYHPATGDHLDSALVLWLPGPNSFTGEDQVELHIHGGNAVRAALLNALATLPGVRPAEPGEFMHRAFLAGRVDLSEAEGFADLIDAETEAQRRQAVRQMDGAMRRQVDAWRERVIAAAACLEAALDFSDEGDVPSDLADEAQAIMRDVAGEIQVALADASGERLRDGFAVVIAGPPNAGKSTLLNALARRDVAIVSPVAGTTRDAIEVRCDLSGLPVTFVDTAGLRDSLDPIESEGIKRTRSRMADADLVLWLSPAGREGMSESPASSVSSNCIHVVTKIDAVDQPTATGADLLVSAVTGSGMDELVKVVQERAGQSLLGSGDGLITRERHRRALTEIVGALRRSQTLLDRHSEELAAEELRVALANLGRVTGRVDIEQVLDRIFGQFCIGK